MEPDLAARLRRIMRGETTAESGVTCVTGVTAVANNVSKLLELQQLRRQRHGNNDWGKGVNSGVAKGVVGLPEPDPVEVDERRAMAMGNVPEVYLDGWARLQLQRPHGVTDARWRQAVNDAGLFLDRWGTHASELRWPPGDLFVYRPAMTPAAWRGACMTGVASALCGIQTPMNRSVLSALQR